MSLPTSSRSRLLSFAFSLAVLGAVPACGPESEGVEDPIVDDAGSPPEQPDAGELPDAGPPPPPPFKVRESVEQLHVTHAEAGVVLVLEDANGNEVQRGTTDNLGSLIFRKVAPNSGYVIRADTGPSGEVGSLSVVSAAGSLPPQDFYAKQVLAPGFNYIATRDGTTLSAYVNLPGPIEQGPYPTVVNYSGYEPSKPGEPLGNFGILCNQFPVLCDAPNDPSSLISGLMGYATVSVNMRGTGCSGGAYDDFEKLPLLDGYDVIETVAAQSWVLHHKVGMVGLSYPGITQLFVASERPPSLAAITPLSVIGNTATTLLPGGILNEGFALAWVSNVLGGTKPYGQGWERPLVDAGDEVCEENQLLHGQAVDNVALATGTPFYAPEIMDPLNPTLLVDRIDVPVFLASSFQDEQTGPYFTTLLDRFSASPQLKVMLYNGIHADGFAPEVVSEWKAFLDLYVARRKPAIDDSVRQLAPLLFGQVFGAQVQLPPDRFAGFADFNAALAAYEDEDPVWLIFESGAGGKPGEPVGTMHHLFPSWPAPGLKPHRLYLRADGSLASAAPESDEGATEFELDPAAGSRGIMAPGGDVNYLLPAYAWTEPAEGFGASWASEPLDQPLVMFGTGSVDLYVRSNVDDADLEVTLSEVRPDGQEMYVQAGWLRASQRKLTADSTELEPKPTQREADVTPLPANEWSLVRVQLPGFAHVFRAGSRIRLSVDTPGDSRPSWRFRLKTFEGEAKHRIAHLAAHPSSVALPLLDGVDIPTALPACPSLRGQPCRTYAPVANTVVP